LDGNGFGAPWNENCGPERCGVANTTLTNSDDEISVKSMVIIVMVEVVVMRMMMID